MFVEPMSDIGYPGGTQVLRRCMEISLLGLLCWVIPAAAQISLVHATACGPVTLPGNSCTIPATAAGNLLVVGWEIGGGVNTATGISSISDNAGNSYAEAGAAKSIDAVAGSAIDIWYSKNIAAGATSITVTPSASVTGAGIVVWEFSGADASVPLDTTTVLNSQTASATPQSASVTTSAGGDVVIALVAVSGNVAGIAAGNPFTNDSLLKGNGWAHLIASAQGTYAAQWTQSPSGTYASSTVAFKAAGSASTNACDLNLDSLVNGADVTLALNMALGTTPCTAKVEGNLTCTVITVQRVVNAALGQTCITYNGHGTTLNWVASTSQNVLGYNIYRGTTAGGPYTKINASVITGTTYFDSGVQAGQTYFYVATTVDVSGNESGFSNQATAVIPTP